MTKIYPRIADRIWPEQRLDDKLFDKIELSVRRYKDAADFLLTADDRKALGKLSAEYQISASLEKSALDTKPAKKTLAQLEKTAKNLHSLLVQELHRKEGSDQLHLLLASQNLGDPDDAIYALTRLELSCHKALELLNSRSRRGPSRKHAADEFIEALCAFFSAKGLRPTTNYSYDSGGRPSPFTEFAYMLCQVVMADEELSRIAIEERAHRLLERTKGAE